MKCWFLVQCKSNAHQIAKRNLERQGFVVFQPMEKQTLMRRGKFCIQLRPFFSGYLFVSYPAIATPLSVINSTYGVSRLVSFGDRPAPVPNDIICELQDACDENEVIFFAKGLSQGDKVEITSGPLTNFIGQVEKLSPNHRAMVLLDFMGKQTKIEVDRSYIRAASEPLKKLGAR